MAGKMLRATLALASLLATAGCTSLIPSYERPAAPVAAAFPDAGTATGEAAAALPWERFVTDPRQARLVQLALLNNRDLRVAVLNVEAARAALGVQRADEWPSLGAAVGAQRAPNTSGREANTFTAGLAVSAFELDLFGRVRSLSEAARARYFASDEGRRASQLALVAGVVAADIALRADEELVALTQRTLDSRQEGLRLMRVKFDGGAAAEGDLRSAESLVAAARVSLVSLQRQRSQDLNALVLLLGQPVPAELPAPGPLAALTYAELPAGLPSEVLLQRPDVRQAEQQLIAANATIGAARAAFFPRISLTGSAGFASTELSSLLDHSAFTLSAQLLQPIFDGGRNQSNLAASRAQRDIAVAQYEKTLQTAFREVADALAGRATLSEQLAAQQAQAEAESRRRELAELLYQGGVASQFERLDAERSALAARQAVLQLQAARLQNAVLLYRALGGGAASEPARP